MRNQSRGTSLRLLVSYGSLQLALACSQGAGDLDSTADSTLVDVRSRCTGIAAGPTIADSVFDDGLSALIDLDCDGSPERLQMSWASRSGVSYPRVDVSGATLSGELLLERDGLPQFVEFGDLTGDGIRDILFVTADESSVLFGVVLVSGSALVEPRSEGLDWRRLQFTYDEDEEISRCPSFVLPRLNFTAGAPGLVVVASRKSGAQTDCSDPALHRLRVVNGKLTP
jgi:hypothetical protein